MQSKNSSTRLSTIHPYPAMIADELAVSLSLKFVTDRARVLDPFCGTGRTLLAAASTGSATQCVGVDVNPLSRLLVLAKATQFNRNVIEQLLSEVPVGKTPRKCCLNLNLEPGRTVPWFSKKSRQDIAGLVDWVNSKNLRSGELYIVASVLSATVREVSYCDKSQWKLYRLPAARRQKGYRSAWRVFKRRLSNILREPTLEDNACGYVTPLIGDARKLETVLREHSQSKKFDVIITSPPYGDSFTTVQYGGMSSICLGVLQHLRGLNLPFASAVQIDGACLGGNRVIRSNARAVDVRSYWNGGKENSARERVTAFLSDFSESLHGCARVLNKNGRLVFILSRRSAGGWRLQLDKFVEDVLHDNGFVVEQKFVRKIQGKILPYRINRLARSVKRNHSRAKISTMRREIIVVLKRKSKRLRVD